MRSGQAIHYAVSQRALAEEVPYYCHNMLDDPLLIHEWFAVARSTDVPAAEPVAACLLGRELVLWRSTNGVRAWQDLCIHRGAKLSLGKVRNDCLVCPYHAWEYDATGRCVRIPAHPAQVPPLKATARVFRVMERYGLIWVCLGEPLHGLPDLPELDDPTYRKLLAGPYAFHAQGPRIIENFLDVAHLPIVHGGWLGDSEHAEMADYTVEVSADGIIARDIAIWQPDPDGAARPAKVLYTYQVHRPLTASFRKLHNGQSFLMVDIVTPIDEQNSTAWAILALNYGHDLPDSDLLDFQDKITMQDKPVVESQRPELLPLDLQAELHLRSDKTAIAYRRWLREIGLSYGTA
jgi:phenylpropionate dioxygenase-like ring-hydroxylating dioxygenase large terminal subunit